nr:hypothetical protein [Tanacetum cinerariifolium]
MSDSSAGMSDLDDIDDMEMIMQQLRYEQSLQEQEVESSNRRNYIYRECDVAEERLMADEVVFLCIKYNILIISKLNLHRSSLTELK